MKVCITRRQRRILEAIHTADQAPSTLAICKATGYGSGSVYPILERLLLAGWIGGKPHPTVPGWTVYHLTMRSQLRTGLDEPKEQQP